LRYWRGGETLIVVEGGLLGTVKEVRVVGAFPNTAGGVEVKKKNRSHTHTDREQHPRHRHAHAHDKNTPNEHLPQALNNARRWRDDGAG